MCFQVSPERTHCMVLLVTPCSAANSASDCVYPTERICRTASGVSRTDDEDSALAYFGTREDPRALPKALLVLPKSLLTVCCRMPKVFAMNFWVYRRETPISRIAATSSSEMEACVPSSRPFTDACTMFSLRVAHSKLPSVLLDGLQSLWFTSVCSCPGVPKNAIATSRCTKYPHAAALPPAARDSRYRLTLLYACRSLSNLRYLPGSTYQLWPPFRAFTLSRLLTRPKSLTSYSPSYPTTGSQLSSLISHLSSGIRSLFLGAARRLLLGFQELLKGPPYQFGHRNILLGGQ